MRRHEGGLLFGCVFFLFISRDLIAGPNCLFNAYIYEEQGTNYFKVSFCVM